MDNCAADRGVNHHNCHNQELKEQGPLRESLCHNVRRTMNHSLFLKFKKIVAHFIFQSLRCKIALITIIHSTAATIKLVFFISGVDIGSHSE